MAEDRTIPRISNIFGKNHERKESMPGGMASKLQIRQQLLFTIFLIRPKKNKHRKDKYKRWTALFVTVNTYFFCYLPN